MKQNEWKEQLKAELKSLACGRGPRIQSCCCFCSDVASRYREGAYLPGRTLCFFIVDLAQSVRTQIKQTLEAIDLFFTHLHRIWLITCMLEVRGQEIPQDVFSPMIGYR